MASNCIVGAIRWDAWYTQDGPAAETVEALSQPQFQYRAPFFSQVVSTQKVKFVPTQATMDQEITFAKNGGLKYWAFLYYERQPAPASAQMSAGWDLFQSSSTKSNMNWCWIHPPGTLAAGGIYPATTWQARVTEIVGHMQQANWQKVMGNRPLFYVYWLADEVTKYWGNAANMKVAIDAIRSGAQSAGLGDPYVVVLGGSEPQANTDRVSIGADAVSCYASRIPDTLGSTYPELDVKAQTQWAAFAATGSAVVPTVMCGWDRRPRIERPTSWVLPGTRPFMAMRKLFIATNTQLVAAFQAAVDYVNGNPSICPSKAILTYAWNEFDEGGWLCPTLGDPAGSKLTAIAPVIT